MENKVSVKTLLSVVGTILIPLLIWGTKVQSRLTEDRVNIRNIQIQQDKIENKIDQIEGKIDQVKKDTREILIKLENKKDRN